MCRILAGGIGAVMAACTIAGDIDVIKVRRHPAIGGMTVVTGIFARNVGWVLAGRDIAVVTRLAGSYDLSMVDHGRWRPEVHAMAILAYSRRLNVRDVFARGIGAVVAAGAIAGNARVVKVCWRPGNRRVAIVAVVTTREMCGMFAGGSNTVVTRSTTAEHLRMIHRVGWQPGD